MSIYSYVAAYHFEETMQENVSVMMITYNRLDLTKRMLENFFANTDTPYRLIVIDNGSVDGTPQFLENMKPTDNQYCISYDYLLNKENRGIAIGRNQALKIANQYDDPWLSTMDNDVEVPNGWLKECIEIIKANPNYCIGVNMEDVRYPLVTKNGKKLQFKGLGNLGTACTVFPRDLHTKIGFFHAYALYGEDDTNFFFRARVAGYQLGYLSEMGKHFGTGELDKGEYREFKDKCRVGNVAKFQKDCRDYTNKTKSIYVGFEE
jgi:GT2 family glycosyltransferase